MKGSGASVVLNRDGTGAGRSGRHVVVAAFSLSFLGAWLAAGLSYVLWPGTAPWLAASAVGALIGAAAAWRLRPAKDRLP